MFSVKNISMAFENNQVLDNISFHINPGEIVALVGRNGSGKTTILKILSQILEADRGRL